MASAHSLARFSDPPTDAEAQLMLDLLTMPSWIANIGDRGVRDLEQARDYIKKGALEAYKQGFGSFVIVLDGELAGIAGIFKRDHLEHPDHGFALLQRFEGRGIARRACQELLENMRFGERDLFGIVSPGNERSIGLLKRLGFKELKTVDEGKTVVFERKGTK